MTRYLIIGGGVAGTTAATAIRSIDAAGNIEILTEEAHRLYSRILLPNYLGGRVERENLFLRNDGFYKEKKIALRTSASAVSIDKANRQVGLADGSTVPYDKLLLALGASSFVIPFPGHKLPGVQAMRTIEDAEQLRAAAGSGKDVVVIGGGLLGLEMASALAQGGSRVTVIEVFPWLLPRQLDRQGGEVLQRILGRQGLSFRLDAKVEAILGDGHVRAVKLPAEEIPASAVLISAGIRPNLDLARAAGIQVEKGIVINDNAETSDPGIWAAGDCTEWKGRNFGIWPAAEEQGQVAGTRMAGGEAVYAGTTIGQTLKVSGVSLFSAGEVNGENESLEERTIGDETYRKVVRGRKGEIIGAILIGDVSERKRLQTAISAAR